MVFSNSKKIKFFTCKNEKSAVEIYRYYVVVE